jgi:hypothetical protein
MHRHSQLDRAQARTRVAANPRARIDYELPHLVGNFLQVFDAKLSQISR